MLIIIGCCYRFFNDFFLDGEFDGFWKMMRVFWDGDVYFVFFFYFRVFDEVVSCDYGLFFMFYRGMNIDRSLVFVCFWGFCEIFCFREI